MKLPYKKNEIQQDNTSAVITTTTTVQPTSTFSTSTVQERQNKSLELWVNEFTDPDLFTPLPKSQRRPRLFPCDDLSPRSIAGQKGSYWVLYNYITGSKTFECDESITYTTHGGFTFLDNLVPLLYRWMGPISLTLYTPSTDFFETLKRVLYLRECTGHSIVKELVTFHILLDSKYFPKEQIPSDPMSLPANCSLQHYPFLKFDEDFPSYRKTNYLGYPVNVARNVAREMSTTHFLLASDIELYPSPNMIPDFLDMIRRNGSEVLRPNPKLFVLPIFELKANVSMLPHNKTELLAMLKNHSAIIFHQGICAACHTVPKFKEWLIHPIKNELNVFHIGERNGAFRSWEPIYIATKSVPFYDERLSWEGKKDKMTQGYILCVLQYEFHILDNAFLVHKPGIKQMKTAVANLTAIRQQERLINKIIRPELISLYGAKTGCTI